MPLTDATLKTITDALNLAAVDLLASNLKQSDIDSELRRIDAARAELAQRAKPDDVPQRATYFKLTAQDNLEAQYKVLQDRGYSGFEIAQHLARYAEAGTYNRLTAEIEKLQEIISKLRAKPDAQGDVWQPLPDGDYTMLGWQAGHTYTLRVSDDGTELEAWSDAPENAYDDGSPKDVEEIGVGEYRLFRRTAPVEAQPVQPVPNWDELPSWVMWWCVNADGRVAVSDDREPIAQEGWDTWTFAHGILDGGGLPVRVIIPIGTDWRILKAQKQAAEAGT